MSDEELLYLYLIAHNEWAFNFLYQKYQKMILSLVRKNFTKFFALPLELNDLASDSYFIFMDSVKNFQTKKNKSFKNYFLTNLNWVILKSLRKYLSRNHQVLNLAVNFQDYLYEPSTIFSYFNDWTNFDFNVLKLSFYEKNVLKLKYQGYSNHEIMAQLNLTYKQVDNAFQRASLKLKRK